LGAAIGGATIVYRGVWPSYFCAPFAAAAVAGRLIGLSAEEMAHALAIALSMATGGAGRPRGGIAARWLLAGIAARSGVLAALAASGGLAGDIGLLDGDWLQTVHGLAADSAALAEDSGTVLRALSLKPFCSAKQAVAAAHGLATIVADGVDPQTIRQIRVFVPRVYAAMIDHDVIPGGRLSSLTSAPYQLALAALRPDGLDDVSRDRIIDEPAVAALMKTVAVEADEALNEYFPARYPARVQVVTAAGTADTLVVDAPGDPGARLDRMAVIAKFRRFTSGLIPAATQGRLIDAAASAFDAEDGPRRLARLYSDVFARRRAAG
jgi:2-methylcitrate dehydratase PrpD